MIRFFISAVFSFFLIIYSFVCSNGEFVKGKDRKQDNQHSLVAIKSRGVLYALTDYNSTNYFLFKGEPMGFQYEILRDFADYLGVRLELRVSPDINSALEWLDEGGCDLVAMDLEPTQNRRQKVDFTIPVHSARQVLVQRKAEKLVRKPRELVGKQIIVQCNTTFPRRLMLFSQGYENHLLEHPKLKSEELIREVAKGRYHYTIADEHIAKVNAAYFKNIDVNTVISERQQLSWAIPKSCGDFKKVLNNWLKSYKKTKKYKFLYYKYFLSTKSDRLIIHEYFTKNSGKISPYDNMIKQYAAIIGWDWQLLAALIYQESHFRSDLVSSRGAFGLMQLMPETAEKYGVDSLSGIASQIRAGVMVLKSMDNSLKSSVPNDLERIKFVLAAYNAGVGHIFDAQRIATKVGRDSSFWYKNVDTCLLLKRLPVFYNSKEVRNGYFIGRQTKAFVDEVLERYQHFLNATR